jgi:signal transduction histidine kinase
MKRRDEPLGSEHGLGAVKRLDAQLAAAFAKTSAIGFTIFDNELCIRAVNNATAQVIGSPVEAAIGNTMRDIIGGAAPAAEARLRRVLVAGESPPAEITAMLPKRRELGYWIQKIVPIQGRSGRITQVASLAVEVTAQRNLEQRFRELGGELLSRNEEYQRLARELHDAIDGYHAALGMNLDRLSQHVSDPERIPELLDQSMEFLDERMRKLAAAVARCFPTDQQ